MEDSVKHAGYHRQLNVSSEILLTPSSLNLISKLKAHVPLTLYLVIMVLIDIVGIVGNSLVVFVIVKMRRMQTYTNWMILNLAASDLAVTLFCIPLDIPLLLEEKWIYGKAFCSLYYPIGSSQLFSSVFTLVNISYVRFYAICFPFKERPSVLHAKIMIVLIRLLSIALVVPTIIVLKYDEETQLCYEDWNPSSGMYYTVTVFLLGFAIPFVIITIGYCCIVYQIVARKKSEDLFIKDKHILKENRRLVKLSVTVTVTFAVCVFSNQLVFLLYTFSDLENYQHQLDLILGSHMFLFLYCAINPFIYNMCSENFRLGVKTSLKVVSNKFSFRATSDRRVITTSV